LDSLEKQYRARGALEQHPEIQQQLLLTLALLRNTVAPAVLGMSPPPVHVAVVGGTNCGKSTVTNILVGEPVASWSLQGGFTTIPTGYAMPELVQGAWHEQPGMLQGLRQLLPEQETAARAAPEYACVALTPPARLDYLYHTVVWDTPDLDSRYAPERLHRVLEILGLADIVVVVLSKEKYADHTAYELLSLLLACGKTILVCLNKFTPTEFPEGREHFQRQMLDTPERQQAVGKPVLLAYVEPTSLTCLWAVPEPTAHPLRAALAAYLRHPHELRQQTCQGAVQYISRHVGTLLQPARRECALLAEWRAQVVARQQECLAFYRQHYLEDEQRYDSFRLALLRLLDLLDVPGINRVTRLIRQVVTAPMRWGWGLLRQLVLSPPQVVPRPEAAVLQESLDTGLKALHTFLLERQEDHRLWRQLRDRFEGTVPDLLAQVARRLQTHEEALAPAIEAAAHQIYARMQASPAQLQAIRGGKLALEVAVTVAAVKSGGFTPDDLLFGSLAYAGLQAAVQIAGERYVHRVKQDLQETQATAMAQLLDETFVAPLLRLPDSSSAEQQALLSAEALHNLEQFARTLAHRWRR
jgi:hypothetical protein